MVNLRTFTYSKPPRQSVLGAACAILLAACSSSTEPRPPEDGLPPLGAAQLQLVRAASCDDLLTRIQDSIIVQLQLRAEQLKAGEDAGYYYFGPSGGVSVDVEASGAPPRADGDSIEVPSSSPAPDSPQAPTAPRDPAQEEGNSGSGGASGEFSGTTRQVEDVDEADIVKTDGDRIYLLHGGNLFVLQGWPANATEMLGSLPIEGWPVEMFVSDGKAVVFSNVYDEIASSRGGVTYYGTAYTKISVLDVSGATPGVLRESFVEGAYASSRRHGDVVRAVIQDGFKIPRLDQPSIQYRDPFGQPFEQADIDTQVDAWLERTARSIRATGLDAWLPRELTRENGALSAVAPRCSDYYSPDPGLTENGVTSVLALDLNDVSAPLAGATILGRAERVYSNEEALLITQTDYRYTYDADEREQTIIHRFEIGGKDTAYTASGAVAGTVHDQFSLDERDGIIRVSTTEQPSGRFIGGVPTSDLPTAPPGAPTAPAPDEPGQGGSGGAAPADVAPSAGAAAPAPGPSEPAFAPPPAPVPQGPTSVSRVVTLGVDGDALKQLGATEDFGRTERIFATRFIGDRAYVVTFRQTDPLFVIDLVDPANPHVVGELHIPGFSNYLFPLDEDHLFAIGRDATSEGVVQGLALQIFDVSDPASPALSAKYVFEDVGDSPANIDHRAISFHPDRDVVAFPHQSYSTGESTLELFQLESTRITRLGAIGLLEDADIDLCITKYWGWPAGSAEFEELSAQVAANAALRRDVLASCRYGNNFRRGLFRDDFVYGISNTGVYVYDMTEMGAGALSEVSLPAEVYDNAGYEDGGAGTPVPMDGGGSSSAGAAAGGSPGSEE